MTKRATHKELNTLSCIVIGLQGFKTVIELQNDSFVYGKIICADAMMNVDMEDVKYTDGNGFTYNLDNFYVKGRKIRYVHIPETIDVMKLISDQVILKPREPKKPSIREKIIRKKDLQTLRRYHNSLNK